MSVMFHKSATVTTPGEWGQYSTLFDLDLEMAASRNDDMKCLT